MKQRIHILDVDVHNAALTPSEAVGLALAKDKWERYVSKGLTHEAHGAASAITIIYQALIGVQHVDTGWGEL
jgi:hypothetical protein